MAPDDINHRSQPDAADALGRRLLAMQSRMYFGVLALVVSAGLVASCGGNAPADSSEASQSVVGTTPLTEPSQLEAADVAASPQVETDAATDSVQALPDEQAPTDPVQEAAPEPANAECNPDTVGQMLIDAEYGEYECWPAQAYGGDCTLDNWEDKGQVVTPDGTVWSCSPTGWTDWGSNAGGESSTFTTSETEPRVSDGCSSMRVPNGFVYVSVCNNTHALSAVVNLGQTDIASARFDVQEFKDVGLGLDWYEQREADIIDVLEGLDEIRAYAPESQTVRQMLDAARAASPDSLCRVGVAEVYALIGDKLSVSEDELCAE